MTSRKAALSRTDRLTAPTTVRPSQDSVPLGPPGTRPRDGFMPNTPHAAAGQQIEPPPSDACAIATTPLATATAVPPLEPPALWPWCQGLRVRP